MANTGKLIGANYVIARDSGSWGTAAHIPLIAAKDIKVTAKPAAVVDASDRVSSPVYEKVIPAMHSLEVGFNALWNGGAGLTAIRDRLVDGASIRLAVINARPAATTAGDGYGWRGDWLVKKIGIKYPMRGAQEWDVTLVPHGLYTNAIVTYQDTTTILGTPETQATKKLGYNASVNDSTNAPITGIRDITLDLEWDTADFTDRAAASPNNHELFAPTRLKINLGVDFIWKEDDTQLVAFRTAWRANSAVLLSVLDGAYAVAGSWGPGAAGGISWFVTDYPHDNPLTDGQMVSIKLQPAGNYTVAPAFLTTS